jgi:hypothetical protein
MKNWSFVQKAAFGGFLVIFSGAFFLSNSALAQTASSPTFLVTWKTTGSYIPSFYQGKALPTYGSNITASLELISPQGKPIDLSNQTIYWYVDDNLVGGGVGTQQVTFPPIGEAPNSFTLRVTLPFYSGGFLVHQITVPMVLPQAVLLAPYPGGQFSQNPLTVMALPYFFNISDPSNLSYAWSVNGQTGSNTENPEQVQITLPQGTQSGTALAISLSVENPNDSTASTASANLTYESQL